MDYITDLINEIKATADDLSQACFATCYSHKERGLVDMVSEYGLVYTLQEIAAWLD